MLKIGIIGAQSTHCAAIAEICNLRRLVGARVAAVWGETPGLARAAAEAGRVPLIVKDWRDMLGRVDGVMIDHRHPRPHYPAAKFFLEHGVPCFVDKPLTERLSQAKALRALAQRQKTGLTTFSIIPFSRSFRGFKKKCAGLGPISHVNMTGPADLKSKYGGIYFYGIHQVDAMIDLLGVEVERVHVMPRAGHAAAVVRYKDGRIATLNLVHSGCRLFHWSAVGRDKILDWTHQHDATPYLEGARIFVKMFRTGRWPVEVRRMLAPIAVLEAMTRSLQSGKAAHVASF